MVIVMTEKKFTHNCFKCKHSDWEYHYEVPVIRQFWCKLGHEQTSYNTPYDQGFICQDYKRAYFNDGIWFWVIYCSVLAVLVILSKMGMI